MHTCRLFLIVIASCLLLASSPSSSPINVVTYHYDNGRTGQNIQETILNPANVNANKFGKLFSQPVDGQVYAQPLELQDVQIPGLGQHNVLYIATEHDGVYAFDADNNSGANANPLWYDSFIDPAHGITTIPASDVGTNMIYPEIGITSTPVIGNNTLFVLAATKENGNYFQRLHALNVATGVEIPGSPVVIQATVPGTGWGSVNGQISFNALYENQRAALLLSNGVVYIAWASHGLEATNPYHGWVIGYDASTLAQVAVLNLTPNAAQGGIWQSGGGLAGDDLGNVYGITGNGTFDASSGGQDYGMSFLKFGTAGGLTVVDYFSPYNELQLSENDEDLGAGGPLLFPGETTAKTSPLMVGAGKDATIYLTNTSHMGGFNATQNNNLQTIENAFHGHGVFNNAAYWQRKLYFCAVGYPLQIFALKDGLINPIPIAQSSATFAFPGATPTISSDGNSNGIAWLLEFNHNGETGGHGGPAVLHAFDPNTAVEIYNSNQAGTRDVPGNSIKFTTPVIANGKVYIGTATEIDVFGLLSQKTQLRDAAPFTKE